MESYFFTNPRLLPIIIEVFRREKNGFWTLYTLGRDDTVQLLHLGIHFSVAEVYQNTSFEEESA